MKTLKLRFWVDVLAFLALLITVATGLIIGVLRALSDRGSAVFLGLRLGKWSSLHGLIGMIMFIIILVHLVMHWDWVVYATRKMWGKEKGNSSGK